MISELLQLAVNVVCVRVYKGTEARVCAETVKNV